LNDIHATIPTGGTDKDCQLLPNAIELKIPENQSIKRKPCLAHNCMALPPRN